MTRWRMVTFAWLAVAFLLIARCSQALGAGLDLPHPIAFSVRSVSGTFLGLAHGGAPALLTSTPDQTRARSFELLADHPGLLSEGEGCSLSSDSRGPPGPGFVQGPFVHGWAAGETGSPSNRTVSDVHAKSKRQRVATPKKGFCNSL